MLYVLTACTALDSVGPIAVLDAVVGATPTAYTLTLDTPEATELVGVDDQGDRLVVTTIDQGDGTSAASVVGLPAGSRWTWTGGGASLALDVESEPSNFPALFADGDVDAEGWYLVSLPVSAPASVAVVDRQGRYRWWPVTDDPVTVAEIWLASSGDAVLWNAFGGYSGIHRTSFTGEDTWTPVGGHHHDFVELPDGSYGALAEDVRRVGDADVVGDQLLRVQPDGSSTVVWTTWDDFPYDGSLGDSGRIEWTHCNSVRYAADTNLWLVSVHNLDTVVAIDGATGRRRWSLGGPQALVLDGDSPFAGQHAATFVDGGVAMFDNRLGEDGLWSRAVRYTVDLDGGSYTPTWTFDDDRSTFTAILGNVDVHDDDDVTVGWGSAGRITEVAPDGTVQWSLDAALGGSFGYVHPTAAWW